MSEKPWVYMVISRKRPILFENAVQAAYAALCADLGTKHIARSLIEAADVDFSFVAAHALEGKDTTQVDYYLSYQDHLLRFVSGRGLPAAFVWVGQLGHVAPNGELAYEKVPGSIPVDASLRLYAQAKMVPFVWAYVTSAAKHVFVAA